MGSIPIRATLQELIVFSPAIKEAGIKCHVPLTLNSLVIFLLVPCKYSEIVVFFYVLNFTPEVVGMLEG